MTQTSRLSFDVRLDRAAQHVIRARLYFDLWFYFEGDTRSRIIETMREYNEFFRFTPHAYLAAYLIYIAGLFETRRDTINLGRLFAEMKSSGRLQAQSATEIDVLLTKAKPIVSKAMILRHNAFAHRAAELSYDDAFRKAAITWAKMRELTDLALKVANRLLVANGNSEQHFTPLPKEAAAAMMKALAR